MVEASNRLGAASQEDAAHLPSVEEAGFEESKANRLDYRLDRRFDFAEIPKIPPEEIKVNISAVNQKNFYFIEYCLDCENHATFTSHDPKAYAGECVQIGKLLGKKCNLNQFVGAWKEQVDSIAGSLDQPDQKALKYKPRVNNNIPIREDEKMKLKPRLGALEIYANIGAPLNETRIICLHSKLESGRFPRRELIVEVALLAMADVALGEPLDVVEQNCLAFYANEDIEEYRGKSRRYYDLAVIQTLVKEAAESIVEDELTKVVNETSIIEKDTREKVKVVFDKVADTKAIDLVMAEIEEIATKEAEKKAKVKIVDQSEQIADQLRLQIAEQIVADQIDQVATALYNEENADLIKFEKEVKTVVDKVIETHVTQEIDIQIASVVDDICEENHIVNETVEEVIQEVARMTINQNIEYIAEQEVEGGMGTNQTTDTIEFYTAAKLVNEQIKLIAAEEAEKEKKLEKQKPKPPAEPSGPSTGPGVVLDKWKDGPLPGSDDKIDDLLADMLEYICLNIVNHAIDVKATQIYEDEKGEDVPDPNQPPLPPLQIIEVGEEAQPPAHSYQGGPYYYSWNKGGFNETVFCYDPVNQNDDLKLIENEDNFNFSGFKSIQVNQSLYRLSVGRVSCFEFTNLDNSDELKIIKKADQRIARQDATLANYEDQLIFVCGGRNPDDIENKFNSVDMYSIEKDEWTPAPNLNVSRDKASSVALAQKLYMMCGQTFQGVLLNSIEILDVAGFLDPAADTPQWQLIEPKSTDLSTRSNILAGPISATEIIIFGGYYKNKNLESAFIFDTTQNKVKRIHSEGFKFHSIASLCVPIKEGQVASLVTDVNRHVKFVYYDRTDGKLRVISDLGSWDEPPPANPNKQPPLVPQLTVVYEPVQPQHQPPANQIQALKGPFYWSFVNGQKFHNTAFQYDPQTLTEQKFTQVQHADASFWGYRSIQVGQDFYAHEVGYSLEWIKWSNLHDEKVTQTKMAQKLEGRYDAFLINFEDKLVFITGGTNPRNRHSHIYNSVDQYSIEDDKWTPAPNMKLSRYNHSGCSLGGKIYVFCGWTDNDICTNTIESLDMKALLNEGKSEDTAPVEWDLIKPPKEDLLKRSNLLACPMSDTKIVIIGGRSQSNTSLEDVYMFNTVSKEVDLIHSSGFNFLGIGSQCVATGINQASALVLDSNWHLCYITYTRDNSTCWVETIGPYWWSKDDLGETEVKRPEQPEQKTPPEIKPLIIKEKGEDSEEEKGKEEEKYEVPNDDADSEEEFKGVGLIYFGFNRGTRFNQTLFKFDPESREVISLKHKNNQFQGFKTIQVKDLVYRIAVGRVSNYEYSNFDREIVEGTNPVEYKLNIVKTKREDKPRARQDAVLLNFEDKALFMIGGQNDQEEKFSSVDYYTIETDSWTFAPELTIARSNSSGCVVKGKIYIFAGVTHKNQYVNSIECLDAAQHISNKDFVWKKQWRLIQVSTATLSLRSNILVGAISSTDIILLGGFANGRMMEDVYIFDSKTERLETKHPSGFKFFSLASYCTMIRPGEVAGFVTDTDHVLKCITYSRKTGILKVIDKFDDINAVDPDYVPPAPGPALVIVPEADQDRVRSEQVDDNVAEPTDPFLFGWVNEGRFDETLFSYRADRRELTRHEHRSYQLGGYRSIQVGPHKMFACGIGDDTSWWLIENCTLENPTRTPKADMLTERWDAFLMNYENKILFICGGSSTENRYNDVFDSVEKYDIARDQWSEAPSLNEARYSHSGCCLNGQMYVFCGINEDDEPLSSIESLNVKALEGGQPQKWQLVDIPEPVFMLPRTNVIVAPINNKDIFILGGGEFQDAYIFDTDETTLTQKHATGFKYNSVACQCIMTRPGHIVALVQHNDTNKLNFVRYELKDGQLFIVEEIGDYFRLPGQPRPYSYYERQERQKQKSKVKQKIKPTGERIRQPPGPMTVEPLKYKMSASAERVGHMPSIQNGIFFGFGQGKRHSRTIFRYNPAGETPMAKIILERFRMPGYCNIQVDQRLFQLGYGRNKEMFAFQGIATSNTYRRWKSEQLIQGRYDYCVVNYENQYLIQSGGCNENQDEIYQRVDYYDTIEDVWKEAPDMVKARTSHSGCTMGQKVYFFCGKTKGDNGTQVMLNSVDCLNIVALVDEEQKAEFTLIELPNEFISSRCYPLVCPISSYEIAIFGGCDGTYDRKPVGVQEDRQDLRNWKEKSFEDSVVFDTVSETIDLLHPSGFKFRTKNGLIYETPQCGKLVAMVTDERLHLKFVTYIRERGLLKVIDDMGPVNFMERPQQ